MVYDCRDNVIIMQALPLRVHGSPGKDIAVSALQCCRDLFIQFNRTDDVILFYFRLFTVFFYSESSTTRVYVYIYVYFLVEKRRPGWWWWWTVLLLYRFTRERATSACANVQLNAHVVGRASGVIKRPSRCHLLDQIAARSTARALLQRPRSAEANGV